MVRMRWDDSLCLSLKGTKIPARITLFACVCLCADAGVCMCDLLSFVSFV